MIVPKIHSTARQYVINLKSTFGQIAQAKFRPRLGSDLALSTYDIAFGTLADYRPILYNHRCGRQPIQRQIVQDIDKLHSMIKRLRLDRRTRNAGKHDNKRVTSQRSSITVPMNERHKPAHPVLGLVLALEP